MANVSVKDHVDFECTVCGMTIKKAEPVIESEGPRSDTIYYKHAKHGKEMDADNS